MEIETIITIFSILLPVETIVGLIARRLVSGKWLLVTVALQGIPFLLFGLMRLMYPWEDLNSDSTHVAGVLMGSAPLEMLLVPVGLLMLLICSINLVRQKRSPNQAAHDTARKLADPGR